MAAERPVDLINHNDLALNLNTPCRISDISWIKPGKVFRSGDLKQEKVKAAIDFAAERGIQYGCRMVWPGNENEFGCYYGFSG